jgi:hypothetical protein
MAEMEKEKLQFRFNQNFNECGVNKGWWIRLYYITILIFMGHTTLLSENKTDLSDNEWKKEHDKTNVPDRLHGSIWSYRF